MHADAPSEVLHSMRMRELRAIRRHNLSLLSRSFGREELAKATGLPAAYLYQMSDGEGKQARGISDAKARIIEAGASLDDGWMDIDRRELGNNVIEVDVKAAKIRRATAWPFKTIERERFEQLDEGDRLRVEGAMIKAITAIENAPSSRGPVRLPRKR
jgi:hypothetical protein